MLILNGALSRYCYIHSGVYCIFPRDRIYQSYKNDTEKYNLHPPPPKKNTTMLYALYSTTLITGHIISTFSL